MANGLTPAAMAAILRERPPRELYEVDICRGDEPIFTVRGDGAFVAQQLDNLKGPDLTVSRVMLVESQDAG